MRVFDEGRSRLVECDVPVRAYSTHEQVNTAIACDLCFVFSAFLFGVGCVSVQDIYVFWKDVDLVEEVGPHEGVVALFMVAWNATVFVHVECHDIAEGYFTFLIKLDQVSVHAKWRASCRASG